jgi:excisionase family DNA binding protein
MSSQDRVPIVLTVPQVAEALQVSRGHVYQLLQSGELPSVRIGRNRRVVASALDDYLTGLSAETYSV